MPILPQCAQDAGSEEFAVGAWAAPGLGHRRAGQSGQ